MSRGGLDKTFCVLPWIHLATHPQGLVSLCCRVDFTCGRGMAKNKTRSGEHYLRLGKSGINEILNSETHRQARAQMLRGEMPLACRGCYKDEEQGLQSKRQRENVEFKEYGINRLREITGLDGEVRADLAFIELRLGRKCNLKCRTCNPASSSSWAMEYTRVQRGLNFVRSYEPEINDDWCEDKGFWRDLLVHSGDLRTVYVNGGEPMLNDSHWWFLNELIQNGRARDVELLYNINMTLLPERAFQLWAKFRRVHIGASIDDVGERNAYIRSKSDWDKVWSNLIRLRDSGISLGITQTVSAYNFFYLDELWKMAQAAGIGLGHNLVYDPDFLSVDALPLKVREHALLELRKRLPKEIWQPLDAKFRGEDRPELWRKFCDYTRFLDGERGEDFSEVFPELLALMNSQDVEWLA